jgi:hypothetical protein
LIPAMISDDGLSDKGEVGLVGDPSIGRPLDSVSHVVVDEVG